MIQAGPSYEPLLTDHIIDFPVEGAVADIVSRRVDSGEKGKYEVYDKSSFKIPAIEPRVGMNVAKTFTLASGEEDYKTKNYTIAMELTNAFIREQEKLGRDPRLIRAEQVKTAMTRAREKRVADMFGAATNYINMTAYSSENTLNVYFDDYTNSHPFKTMGYYIAYFISLCGTNPTHILFNPFIEYILANHPDRDTKSSQSVDKISDNTLGQKVLNMNKIIGALPYDSTKKGRDASVSFIWGNNVYLMYIPQDVSTSSPTASKTFDAGREVRGVQGISISEKNGSDREPGIYIEGEENIDEQITCQSAILVLKNVLLNPTPTV